MTQYLRANDGTKPRVEGIKEKSFKVSLIGCRPL